MYSNENNKILIFIITSVIIITQTACYCEKDRNQNVTIIKDCTGAYFQIDRKGYKKNYKVCNVENVDSFPNGAVVTVTFKKINNCKESGNSVVTCYLLHIYEGWVEVEKIKDKKIK